MSYVTNPSTTEAARTRLEILRNYHETVVCTGEERLRAAMAEYAQHFRLSQERDREPV